MRKVVVFDDDGAIRRNWKQDLEKVLPEDWSTIEVDNNKFLEAVLHLRERRVAARHPEKSFEYKSTFFDEADVVFIDYDLIELNENIDITGEEVAYLARCYSSCKYIVSINQLYVSPTFDLTLDAHLDYFADLHLSGDDVTSVGLWSDDYQDYRPWNWPHIPTAVDLQEKRTDELLQIFEQPILEYFRFPASTPMPDMLSDFLALPGDIERVTFADALESTRLKRPKDELLDGDEYKARLIAARLHKWLQQGVLPLLRVIMDAPHLTYRFPSLLKGDIASLDLWNQTAKIAEGDAIPIDMERIGPQKFKRENWLDRPAWFWHEIQMNREIQEVANPRTRESLKYGFCEDASRFLMRDEATEFDTGHIDAFSTRFIKKFEDVNYVPTRNLFL